MFKVPNEFREKSNPQMRSTDADGNNGLFVIPHERIKNYWYGCIAADGEGWEHVSVQIFEKGKRAKRLPTWSEMCYIKHKFWSRDMCIIQYHPEEKEYVNLHPFVLHLWRPTAIEIPIPPKEMIG